MVGCTKEMEVRTLQFLDTFRNETLDCPAYAELRKHLLFDGKGKNEVVTFQRSLCRLKDASRILSELIKEDFAAVGRKKKHTVPCVFHVGPVIAVCYVNNLLAFSEIPKNIEQLK